MKPVFSKELLKLRKKITSTVQVLTHLKEKLQFVQAENQVRKQQLSEVETEVAKVTNIYILRFLVMLSNVFIYGPKNLPWSYILNAFMAAVCPYLYISYLTYVDMADVKNS